MRTPSSHEDPDHLEVGKLQETLKKARNIGSELVSKGKELSAVGQNIMDWAEVTIEAIPFIDKPQGIYAINNSWIYTNTVVGKTLNKLDEIDLTSIASTAGGSALTSVLNLPVLIVYPVHTPDQHEDGQRVSRRIQELISNPHEKEVVITLMKTSGLNSAPAGMRSPLEQSETAHKAFEVTVDTSTPALTSLIPMRECIHETISFLLKRRKIQEKAPNTQTKVVSILKQLKRDTIRQEGIDTLAFQCDEILDKELSSSKQSKVTRSEWQHALMTSTLWLRSFLSAIDPNKLRSLTT